MRFVFLEDFMPFNQGMQEHLRRVETALTIGARPCWMMFWMSASAAPIVQ
jgi:hypothetical protein